MDPKTLVDYAASLDCIHCGLCLSSCPTYRLTGREASSPRGRVFLMRAVAEERLPADATYAEELDFCLVCRNCESVCPAGVRFGEMMETARDGLGKQHTLVARLARWLGFGVVLPHRFALRLAAFGLRTAQRTGLLRLLAPLAGARGRASLARPPMPGASERRLLPPVTPAAARDGTSRGRALAFEGCVMPELFGRVNRATVECLARAGYEVHCPPGRSTCCGALHAHNGDLDGARALARRTIETWNVPRAAAPAGGDTTPVVVNSAGCAAHMKEYGRLFAHDATWSARAQAFAARVVDFAEFLAPQANELPARLVPGAFAGPVTWDDPCHLCHGQGLRDEPRALLDSIAGLERVELEDSESCCGSAGIYSLLRPADSQAVFAAKLEAFERSGATALVTANPGCHLQWQTGFARAGRDVPVFHLAELLAQAWRTGEA